MHHYEFLLAHLCQAFILVWPYHNQNLTSLLPIKLYIPIQLVGGIFFPYTIRYGDIPSMVLYVV